MTNKKAIHLKLLRALHGGSPVRFPYWTFVHRAAKRVIHGDDPLFEEPPLSEGKALRDDRLRQLLEHDKLGAWSLDPATIDLVWAQLFKHRPRTIIECGAGASTLVIGKYIANSGVPDALSVSVEQNLPYKEQVERRVVSHGMDRSVRVVHAPLSSVDSYQLDPVTLSAELGARKADLLLIDGPSGRPGCRLWTLPVLSPYCRPGARWFLDDAFRDGEMFVLQAWCRTGGISVDGIYPVAKGLATGVITDPHRVTFESVACAANLAPDSQQVA